MKKYKIKDKQNKYFYKQACTGAQDQAAVLPKT